MLRNELWEEMKEAKTNSICCQRYTHKRRKINKSYNKILLIFPIVGAFTYFLNSWCAFGANIIAAIGILIKNYFPIIIYQPEKELGEIDKLYNFFQDHLNKIATLWNKLENDKQEDENIEMRLRKLQKTLNQKESEMNTLIHKISHKEEKKITDMTDDYLINNFY